MGLDLTGLRPSLEELLLVDRCELWRDPQGALDDEVDPATGSIIGPTPDSLLVATTDCKFKFQQRRPVAVPEGGEPTVVSDYEWKTPVSLVPQAGDRLKVTVSPHDPALVGKWLRVAEPTHGTFSVFRLSLVELRSRASDRP